MAGEAVIVDFTTTNYAGRAHFIDVDVPAGTVDGMLTLLCVFAGTSGASPSISPPLGTTWARLQDVNGDPVSVQVSDGGFDGNIELYWRQWNTGDPTTFTFGTASSASTENNCAVMLAIDGWDGAPPVVVGFDFGTDGGTPPQGKTITVDPDDAFDTTLNDLALFIGQNWDLYGSGNLPTSATQTYNEEVNSSATLFYVASADYDEATIDTAVQADANAVAEPWSGFLVYIAGNAAPAGTIIPQVVYNRREQGIL